MKRKLYLLTLTVVLCTLQIAFAQDSIRQSYHRRTTNQPIQPPSINGLSSSGNSGTGANIDVVYYRCDWTIDPSVSKNISGTVTTYFITTTANVSQITFDLNNTVFGSPVAKYHGTTCVSSFPSTDIFRMTLPVAIAASGTLDSVSITYSGTPPAVSGQEEGFQRGELPPGSGNWYIYTLSESYEERDWWPSKSDMQDKADSLDINITVPNTYWVAANGILVDSAINGANRTFKYKHRYPIATYLVGIGIAKYNRQYRGTVNISGTNVPVAYYTYPNMTGGTLTAAIAAMDVSKSELVQFSNKYGPYPFRNEKHGYYQHNWGGGIEHQTFSGMSGGSMASWSVIAHELAHQWFGDKVTFATWNHLWLAEGFAKYSEALAVELIPGIAGTTTDSSWRRSIKITARALTGTPVILSAASIVNSNTIWTTNNDEAVYQRGAMVVSMLRTMMGDTKFFQGCKDYLNDPLLAYKSATTADLQRNMENQMSGVNLTPFFNAWAVGSGTPNYTGNYYISGNTIQFNLSQTRTPAATPFMPMPVAIRIRNAANTKDTNIVIYHYSATQLGYAGDQYGMGPAGNAFITYNLSFAPSVATIDPTHKTMAAGTLTLVAGPLDVSIINFTAGKSAAGNIINLSLSNNEPVEKVVLLKSFDGTNFTEAGIMTNVNSTGQLNNFEFTDVNPNSKTIYYRAKIFTVNKQSYTAIVKVQGAVNNEVIVSPNPASDIINISFNNLNSEKTAIRVIGADGKTVFESATNNDFIHFDVTTLSSGIYIVQVIKQGKVETTTKFLVRH